jgi:hypothetical protein
MIRTEEGLDLTIEQLARMYQALAALHARVAPLNFQNYLTLAEGPVDHIRRLQKEIDDYLAVAQVPLDDLPDSEPSAGKHAPAPLCTPPPAPSPAASPRPAG